MELLKPENSCLLIAAQVRNGQLKAREQIEYSLSRIKKFSPELNCFTEILESRALSKADDVDAMTQQGIDAGPLAGVPFAVKNLFDIAGVTTLAGSKINLDYAPAKQDAVLIERLEAAGAILVGGLSMGEYAYDFTGENVHTGACRNPWNLDHMSGGSSSGSGSAAGAGLVPLTLGSDTNGSIRVPSSLCGLFGLKPTYGRLPRTGTFPFCDSLDHLGPMARTTTDLALSFDAMQGWDKGDGACTKQPLMKTRNALEKGIEDLSFVQASGYFDCRGFPEAEQAMELVCQALSVTKVSPLSGAEEGRAAAYLITNAESATFHRERLQTRLADFDGDTRERFLAGSLLPASWLVKAQQVRRWWASQMQDVFRDSDIVIAPCTPCTAPEIGTKTLSIKGKLQPLRPNLGLFTQPFSAIGLPVVNVPVWLPEAKLPIGIQIVAPPGREDLCLRVAWQLEQMGIARCLLPSRYQ